MDFLYITGRAVFPDGIRPARIGIDPAAGTIISVEDAAEPGSRDRLLFPGFIDAHVHAREYPRPDDSDPDSLAKWEAACRKEVFASAGEAAINGGVTLIAAMPNDAVPPDNAKRYAKKVQITASSPCPAVLFACVTRESEPWADIPYKVYLDSARSAASFDNWSDLQETLSRYKGRRVFFHAEDPEVLRQLGSGGPRWKTRPPEAEVSAVRRILELSAKFGLKSHLCHISTEKAVTLVQEYNHDAEAKVTCEATPHHLFFSVVDGKPTSSGDQVILNAGLLECNPPLRTEEDRLFIVDALKNGAVDMLASDHAPHTLEDKRNGAPGMPHLDTLGPFASRLLSESGFTPERIAQILATSPGQLFSRDLDVPHGIIAPGWAASLTEVDLGRETIVDQVGIKNRGPFRTRCGWSPFAGFSFPAFVGATIVRGRQYGF
jgi:dihydroorotase